MRIKWTSVHSVVSGNPAAPWVGPGLAERLKRERVQAPKKQDKKKSLFDMFVKTGGRNEKNS
jgi:hypothetical protein